LPSLVRLKQSLLNEIGIKRTDADEETNQWHYHIPMPKNSRPLTVDFIRVVLQCQLQMIRCWSRHPDLRIVEVSHQ
jgi:hypothetical protein